MKLRKLLAQLGLAAVLLTTLNLPLSTAHAQGTAFTYQGRLDIAGTPASGTNDLTFTLYNAVSAGGHGGHQQHLQRSGHHQRPLHRDARFRGGRI